MDSRKIQPSIVSALNGLDFVLNVLDILLGDKNALLDDLQPGLELVNPLVHPFEFVNLQLKLAQTIFDQLHSTKCTEQRADYGTGHRDDSNPRFS